MRASLVEQRLQRAACDSDIITLVPPTPTKPVLSVGLSRGKGYAVGELHSVTPALGRLRWEGLMCKASLT